MEIKHEGFEFQLNNTVGQGRVKQRLFNLILIALIYTLYQYLGETSSFPFFIFAGIILYVLSKALGNFNVFQDTIVANAWISYLVLSLIGLILIVNYRFLYGMDFGPYRDDSFYFDQILRMLNKEATLKVPSLFEYTMLIWYKAASVLKTSPKIIDVIPIVWAIGGLVCALGVSIAKRVSQSDYPTWILLLSLLGNSILTDSVGNFYRDGLMLLFYLLVISFALSRRYVAALIFVFLCGFVRMADGGMALFSLILLYSVQNSHSVRYRFRVLAVGVMLITTIMVIDNYANLGSYMRYYRTDSAKTSLLDQAMDRSQTFLGSKVGTGSQDTVVKLFSLGPVGFVLMPVATIFAPFRFTPFYQNIRAIIEGYNSIPVFGPYPRAIWSYITIILWIFLGPKLVNGLLVAYRGGSLQLAILQLFALGVFGASYISYQPRHRLIFIVLFPVFIALSGETKYLIRHQGKLLTGIFILGIIAANIGVLL